MIFQTLMKVYVTLQIIKNEVKYGKINQIKKDDNPSENAELISTIFDGVDLENIIK